MGWASGSEILSEVWSEVRPHIAPESREKLATNLMRIFRSHDCDTLDELICGAWPEMEKAYDNSRKRT